MMHELSLIKRDPARPACLDLWWAEPETLAGTSMPYVHPLRLEVQEAPLESLDDDLPALWHAGIRGMVCLLNLPGAAATYRSAGFEFLLLPIVDGGVPTMEQFKEFLRFMRRQKVLGHPVAAHCVAGLGRTGVMLAAYLVVQGIPPELAVAQVRAVRPGAVETRRQVEFLHQVQERRQDLSWGEVAGTPP